jgi:hypothetical protein
VRYLDRIHFWMLVEIALSNSGELQQRKKGEAEVVLFFGGMVSLRLRRTAKTDTGEGRWTLKAAGDSKCRERQYETFKSQNYNGQAMPVHK